MFRPTLTGLLSVVAIVLGLSSVSRAADTTEFVHSVQTKPNSAPTLGRDLWFAMAQNYDAGGSGGKYYMLYVTSPKSTTVNVQVTNGKAESFQIQSGAVVPFSIPLTWEITTSGKVESKGIHVWADADIEAYLLSRNPATSDGMYIIPSVGWGKDYVVASYHSLFELTFDYPSEFVIIANQPSTQVEITPTQDIRVTGKPKVVLHGRGSTFIDSLGRGQAVQYQLTQADNADEWDVTGTVIHSNRVIGVVGASQCANIPVSSPYCDHICDMIPPIRSWAKSYYSAQFAKRKGGDSFCFIATKDGQVIYRDNSSSYGLVECVLNEYQSFFDPQVQEATRWYSDAPFLLVQYCNSTDFPTPMANNGIGDPAMVVINPVEQFANKIYFQTPLITSGQGPFENYLNLIVKSSSALRTTLDGLPLASAPRGNKINVDGQYEVWRYSGVAPGTHTVVSDTGVGAYIYGYGAYDSYAWSGHLGNKWIGNSDTSLPIVEIGRQGNTANVKIKRTGTAGLTAVYVDSASNLALRAPSGLPSGEPVPMVDAEITPLDASLDGYLKLLSYDEAGVQTIVTTRFYGTHSAPIAKFEVGPDITFLPTRLGDSSLSTDASIQNTGQSTLIIDAVTIDDPTHFRLEMPQLPYSIAAGGQQPIKIWFKGTSVASYSTTLRVISGEGVTKSISVTAESISDGQLDFTSSAIDFGSVVAGMASVFPVTIKNSGKQAVMLQTASISPSGGPFHIGSGLSLPKELAGGASFTFDMVFTPSAAQTYSADLNVAGTEATHATLHLLGSGLQGSSVAMLSGKSGLEAWFSKGEGLAAIATPSPNPVRQAGSMTLGYALRHGSTVSLEIFDVLGKSVRTIANEQAVSAGIHSFTVDTRGLAAGSYRYLFTIGEERTGGQFVVQK